MTIKSIGSGKVRSGRLPRLGLALRDPMRSYWSCTCTTSGLRAERCLNRRSVKTKGILSVRLCASKLDSPTSLQTY